MAADDIRECDSESRDSATEGTNGRKGARNGGSCEGRNGETGGKRNGDAIGDLEGENCRGTGSFLLCTVRTGAENVDGGEKGLIL